jgi:hypothetical protein
MYATTTDSYGVDSYCREHNCSRFAAIIALNVPEPDRNVVSLYGMRILNTSPGYRPSDAAHLAVRHYRQNPESILER